MGTNTVEGEDTSEPVGAGQQKSCFRLVRFEREVQCDEEVTKPVLDELEAVRFVYAFGVLPSINPKDFQFDCLRNGDFDDDLVRFLRNDLLNSSDSKLSEGNVVALFGKQPEIAANLVGMVGQSVPASLRAEDEGIYCVLTPPNGVTGLENAQLVLFSWLSEDRFEPQQLRESATYVLRLLTRLSPRLVCCLAEQDYATMKAVVAAADNPEEDEDYTQFSVQFKVVQQVDVEDGVDGAVVNSVDVAEWVENAENTQLIKGSYPAIVTQKAWPSRTSTETNRCRYSLSSDGVHSFGQWLQAQADIYRIHLNPNTARNSNLREIILKQFCMWPDVQVNDYRATCARELEAFMAKTAADIDGMVVEYRRRLDVAGIALFNPSLDSRHGEVQDAFLALDGFQKWLQSVCDWKLDRRTRGILDIPHRLRTLRPLIGTVEGIKGAGFVKWMSQFVAMSNDQANRELSKYRDKSGSSAVGHAMSSTVVSEYGKAKSLWWSTIERTLHMAAKVLGESVKKERVNARGEMEAAEGEIVAAAFEMLQGRLLSKAAPLIKLNLVTRRHYIDCEVVREVKLPPVKYLEVAKFTEDHHALNPKMELVRMGRVTLDPSEKILSIFGVKVRSLVIVCVGQHRMRVKLVTFPPPTDSDKLDSPSAKVVKTFGKIASLCDYDPSECTLAILCDETIGIFKFRDSFKTMEQLRTVDLMMRLTLTARPFVDMCYNDHNLYVTDSSDTTQAINTQSDQTSVEFSFAEGQRDGARWSRLFGAADNLVIGTLELESQAAAGGELSVICRLKCVASDDLRHLPALELGVPIVSSNISAQVVDNQLYLLDIAARQLYVLAINVSIHSDSYRIRHCTDDDEDSSKTGGKELMRKQHWIWSLYHMYDKFPVAGLLEPASARSPLSLHFSYLFEADSEVVSRDCRACVALLMQDVTALNKPLHGLNLERDFTVSCRLRDIQFGDTTVRGILQTLITFVPVQICRAEGNSLTIMSNGVDQPLDMMDDARDKWDAVDIANSVRFGLLSPFLTAWRGKCVVVTSMGKQSTGKSYFLNHLSGSSFAIAGNRCTDGAWMTLRVLDNNVLLVVLDFEGIGSFERTDQEDVFLALLNAAVSMLTVFRMEMRMDREIDDLFNKFQRGVQLLQGEEQLFRGQLYMSAKDVNPNDRDRVLMEFQQKFQKLLTANREQNFLTTLYSGNLCVNTSPPLGTFGYYQSLCHTRRKIENIVGGTERRCHASGSSFHDCIRLVLAKIAILDWTSVDKSSQELQLAELMRKIPGVLRTGFIVPVDWQTKDAIPSYIIDPIEEAQDWDLSVEAIASENPELSLASLTIPGRKMLSSLLDDSIDFGAGTCLGNADGVQRIFKVLCHLLNEYYGYADKRADDKRLRSDYAEFDQVLAFLVLRRVKKVALWVETVVGAARFDAVWKQVEQHHVSRFLALFKRCPQSCSNCQLLCLRSAGHSMDMSHDCGSDHKCHGRCDYCSRDPMFKHQEIPGCGSIAGHEGDCDCGTADHTCRGECVLANASNCFRGCSLTVGHDGAHKCSVSHHCCGERCNATNCSGTCVLSVEHKHSVHKCAEVQCPHECEMDQCGAWCGSSDHFHDQPELAKLFADENGQPLPSSVSETAVHMCNSQHQCVAQCESEGVCSKQVQVSNSRFDGNRSHFSFQLKEMLGVRRQCSIVLPPGERDHVGKKHSCTAESSDINEHYCPVRCVACDYICDKPVGHAGLHKTAHGNMKKTEFAAEAGRTDIAWGDERTYQPGETGIAEMCSLYCSTAGRGHVHYLKCDQGNPATCIYPAKLAAQNQRRHCAQALEPFSASAMDELLHDQYWKSVGWEDPCTSASERDEFRKCPYKCNARTHKDEGKTSWCCLNAWHRPELPRGKSASSYVNGHKMACSHASEHGIFHHIFVLDCSGSMRGQPWWVLVDAVRSYLHQRVENGCRSDVVSIVTFGDKGYLELEKRRIMKAENVFIPFHGGGTFYANGLSHASAILSRNDFARYTPALIFFTDGRPADAKRGYKLAAELRESYAVYGLRAFAVGFGRVSSTGVEEIAEQLGGTALETLTGDELSEAFASISKSLGASAGLVVKAGGYL